MSLDYPKRNDWLRVRYTPKHLPPRRYVYINAHHRWQPYNIDSNKAKRLARQLKKTRRS